MHTPGVRAWILCGVLALPFAAGCGNGGPVRHEVSGKVTYKGEPVPEGISAFEPEDGQGSKEGATILDGQYRIPKDKGLFAGHYRVSIVIGNGTSGAGDASPDAPAGWRRGIPGKERAPPEFNRQSKLIREVTAGGPNGFDFDSP